MQLPVKRQVLWLINTSNEFSARAGPTTCGLDSVGGTEEMWAVDIVSQGAYNSVEKKRQSHIKQNSMNRVSAYLSNQMIKTKTGLRV